MQYLTLQAKETGELSVRKWESEEEARGYIRDQFRIIPDFHFRSAKDVTGREYTADNDNIYDSCEWFCGESEGENYYYYQVIEVPDDTDAVVLNGFVCGGMNACIVTEKDEVRDSVTRIFSTMGNEFITPIYGSSNIYIKPFWYGVQPDWYAYIVYDNEPESHYDFSIALNLKNRHDFFINREIED